MVSERSIDLLSGVMLYFHNMWYYSMSVMTLCSLQHLKEYIKNISLHFFEQTKVSSSIWPKRWSISFLSTEGWFLVNLMTSWLWSYLTFWLQVTHGVALDKRIPNFSFFWSWKTQDDNQEKSIHWCRLKMAERPKTKKVAWWNTCKCSCQPTHRSLCRLNLESIEKSLSLNDPCCLTCFSIHYNKNIKWATLLTCWSYEDITVSNFWRKKG